MKKNHFKYFIRSYSLEKEHKIEKNKFKRQILIYRPCFHATRLQVPSANEALCIACICIAFMTITVTSPPPPPPLAVGSATAPQCRQASHNRNRAYNTELVLLFNFRDKARDTTTACANYCRPLPPNTNFPCGRKPEYPEKTPRLSAER